MDWPPVYEYFYFNSRFQSQRICSEVPIVSLYGLIADGNLNATGVVNVLLLIIMYYSFLLFISSVYHLTGHSESSSGISEEALGTQGSDICTERRTKLPRGSPCHEGSR